MEREIEAIREKALGDISSALTIEAVDEARIKYLGRRGKLTHILRGLGTVDEDKRPKIGMLANEMKKEISKFIEERKKELQLQGVADEPVVGIEDITLPGQRRWQSSVHPLTRVFDEIVDIFYGMGFSTERGPEVEEEYYNFTALNFPPDHPALDMQATFFLDRGFVLRTHTSPVQIRTFLKYEPPLRVIAPGRCYRSDKIDASHFPVFHQVEGFFVDEDVTFADLKATLIEFSRKMFGGDLAARFRPSFFPFTEPSAEMDIACLFCKGAGCKVCKKTGWLEILGSGMIDPAVFEAVGYDPEKYTGFAFGLGVERIAMLKYGINDIRLFYENDVKFLEQFI
ncbi:MAG: phenylalanine--tRNA ligase subunit alpha [Candidatus Glassbacteria bacterium]